MVRKINKAVSSPGKARPLLLLIEDNRDSLVAGAHLLATAGFEVEIARGGDDGLIKARRLQPNVIVTDLVMAPTSGLEVCDALHRAEATRGIPVIVYTGVTEAGVLAALCGLGVRVFAIKPCLPTVIGREAYALLERRPVSERVRVVTGYGETLDELASDVQARAVHHNPGP